MSLGGISLYANDGDWLANAIERIQDAVESVLEGHLLMARNHLAQQVRENLGEDVSDRVFGAVLGKSLRSGRTDILPCLTINNRIMRMYHHVENTSKIEGMLEAVRGLLAKQTAVSVEAAQFTCFPHRGWGTKFIAQQLLSYLAFKGQAVFVDDGLFASPAKAILSALGRSL